LKLNACVFTLRQMIVSRNYKTPATKIAKSKVTVMLVPVNKWMGNRPKHVTKKRVEKHWNLTRADHNETDALGIGDWFVRKVLRYTPTKVRQT